MEYDLKVGDPETYSMRYKCNMAIQFENISRFVAKVKLRVKNDSLFIINDKDEEESDSASDTESTSEISDIEEEKDDGCRIQLPL